MNVLEVIAIRALANTPLTITELMAMSEIASPATIHRKLTQLINLGYVVQAHVGNNRRTKYLQRVGRDSCKTQQKQT